jgi:hypothetical protein
LVADTVVVAAGKIERDDYRDGWQLVVDKIENMVDIKNLKNFIMRQFVDFKYRIW